MQGWIYLKPKILYLYNYYGKQRITILTNCPRIVTNYRPSNLFCDINFLIFSACWYLKASSFSGGKQISVTSLEICTETNQVADLVEHILVCWKQQRTMIFPPFFLDVAHKSSVTITHYWIPHDILWIYSLTSIHKSSLIEYQKGIQRVANYTHAQPPCPTQFRKTIPCYIIIITCNDTTSPFKQLLWARGDLDGVCGNRSRGGCFCTRRGE